MDMVCLIGMDCMKYLIIALMLTILSMYAVIDNQADRNIETINVVTRLTSELSEVNRVVSFLTDYRTPPETYLYINPIHLEDYEKPTSPFGIRNNPLRENMGGEDIKIHTGIDLTGSWHGRVVAAAAGIIIDKWYPPGRNYKGHPDFGGYIRILHPDGNITNYGHLSETFYHEKDLVEAGDVIGRLGSTGKSTGEHLHFSIQNASGEFIQPLKYINIKGE